MEWNGHNAPFIISLDVCVLGASWHTSACTARPSLCLSAVPQSNEIAPSARVSHKELSVPTDGKILQQPTTAHTRHMYVHRSLCAPISLLHVNITNQIPRNQR